MLLYFTRVFLQVLIIDPTDTSTKDVLKLVESFVIHTAPIRVGIVFKVNDATALNGLKDAGVAMQCALNYVMQKKDGPAALRLINSILDKANEKVTVNDVKEQLMKQYGDDPEDILGESILSSTKTLILFPILLFFFVL